LPDSVSCGKFVKHLKEAIRRVGVGLEDGG
jgi:hypothetical protein